MGTFVHLCTRFVLWRWWSNRNLHNMASECLRNIHTRSIPATRLLHSPIPPSGWAACHRVCSALASDASVALWQPPIRHSAWDLSRLRGRATTKPTSRRALQHSACYIHSCLILKDDTRCLKDDPCSLYKCPSLPSICSLLLMMFSPLPPGNWLSCHRRS